MSQPVNDRWSWRAGHGQINRVAVQFATQLLRCHGNEPEFAVEFGSQQMSHVDVQPHQLPGFIAERERKVVVQTSNTQCASPRRYAADASVPSPAGSVGGGVVHSLSGTGTTAVCMLSSTWSLEGRLRTMGVRTPRAAPTERTTKTAATASAQYECRSTDAKSALQHAGRQDRERQQTDGSQQITQSAANHPRATNI